jgi:large subunit ribosomal protein L4
MYRGALRSIVSELLRQDRLLVVPELSIEAPRTKALVAKLGQLGVGDCLILVEAMDENLMLAARNLRGVDVVPVDQADPVSLIAFEHVVATQGALKRLEERLA